MSAVTERKSSGLPPIPSPTVRMLPEQSPRQALGSSSRFSHAAVPEAPDSPRHSEGDKPVEKKTTETWTAAKDAFKALGTCLEFAACCLLPFAGDAIAGWGMHRQFTLISTKQLQGQDIVTDLASAQKQYAFYFAANVVNTLVTAAFLAYYASMPIPAAVATGGLLLARLILNARHSGTADGIAEAVKVRVVDGDTRPQRRQRVVQE